MADGYFDAEKFKVLDYAERNGIHELEVRRLNAIAPYVRGGQLESVRRWDTGKRWGWSNEWRPSPKGKQELAALRSQQLSAQPASPIPGYEAKRSEPKTQPTEDNGR